MVYPRVTIIRHVAVVKFETLSRLAMNHTTIVLAYYVQEPNEACVGDDGPPRQVHVDIKDILYGRP